MATLRGLVLLGFWFTSIAIIAPFLILLCRVTGNENVIYRSVRPFILAGLALAGVRVEVSGTERLDPSRTYIFTPNHQSLIETPLLVAYLRHNPGYLAKKELFKYPIFGYGIRLIGVVPVDRSNTQKAIQSANAAVENLRRGKSYAVYPEGTRSYDGRLMPFKKGAFVMAVEAQVPIVPVTFSGATRVMPRTGIKVYPGTVRMTVHEPIETAGCKIEDAPRLMERTREAVRSALWEEREPVEQPAG